MNNVLSLEERKQRDDKKKLICRSNGITFIEIPYWWDRSYGSLYATIYNQRPDLLEKIPSLLPISTKIPSISEKLEAKSNNICFFHSHLILISRSNEEYFNDSN